MSLSVVIPVYNDDESLAYLHQAFYDALGDQPYDWEIILVDEGSTDGSVEILKQFVEDDAQHFVFVALRCNFGQTAAIAAGINHNAHIAVAHC